jgi:Skp family chaperone for outer membrane proteins
VKNPLLLVAAVAVLTCCGVATEARAQGIAIIDLNYIFENYDKFKALTADMKTLVNAAGEDVKKRREEINNLLQQRNRYKVDTPEWKQLDVEITKRSSDLDFQVRTQQKDFALQEARIYYNTYQEILQEVDYYARQKGLILVLRFSGEPVKEFDPATIGKHLNRPVIYYSPTIDITPHILGPLNERYRLAQRGGRPSVPGPGGFQR